MIKTDYHIHTDFSSDSDAPMESMIKKAISLGLTDIAITDHVDFQSDASPYPYQINYDQYTVQFNRLKEKYANEINVVLGVEMGLAPHLVKPIEELAAKYPFEFVIGSSHDVEKMDVYSMRSVFFKDRSKQKAYEIYFNEVLQNIKSFSCFNVYGHIDYIVRYGTYADNSLHYKDFSDIIDVILRELIQRGKGLELNMSGYRYGLDECHPQMAILKQYKKMGGDIITVGSDAHTPQTVGEHFNKAYAILKEAGFNAYTVFKDRKPVWIDLN